MLIICSIGRSGDVWIDLGCVKVHHLDCFIGGGHIGHLVASVKLLCVDCYIGGAHFGHIGRPQMC